MPGAAQRLLHETPATRHAVQFSVLAILTTGGFLLWSYPSLPDLLPVHFGWDRAPNGWQFRTLPRVLLPIFVQLGLFVSFAAVSVLLRFRSDADSAEGLAEAKAAQAAAEAVMLMSAIWIGFQAYAAVALIQLWTSGSATLGRGYSVAEVACLLMTAVVGVRARVQLGRPTPLPYVAAHWRLRQLYCNGSDPALFVPTRDGSRWTLNFGRPAAVMLLGGILVVGLVAPSLILALALR